MRDRLRDSNCLCLVLLPMVQFPDEPVYSEKYYDDTYEYRHVILTKAMAQEVKQMYANKAAAAGQAGAGGPAGPGGQAGTGATHKVLLTEREWRSVGVQQSLGWQHYMQHKPEPHVLLFRRPLNVIK